MASSPGTIWNSCGKIKNIPAKLVKYLGVFKTLFGALDTNNHTYDTLEQDIMINSGGLKSSIVCPRVDTEYTPYLMLESSSLYDNIDFVLTTLKPNITGDFLDNDLKK